MMLKPSDLSILNSLNRPYHSTGFWVENDQSSLAIQGFGIGHLSGVKPASQCNSFFNTKYTVHFVAYIAKSIWIKVVLSNIFY